MSAGTQLIEHSQSNVENIIFLDIIILNPFYFIIFCNKITIYEKFGLFFARDNVKRSLLGPVALKHRLKSHFSSFEIIEKICNNIYQEFPIESLIRDIINKHSLNDLKNHSKNKKRLISKLKRKGYCWNDIEPVLKYYNI